MTKKYEVGGQSVSPKNISALLADWSKSASERFADLQVFAEFAMAHYVKSGDTVYITQTHQAALSTRGVRVATFQTWLCAMVNVTTKGNKAELRYVKDGKGACAYRDGINPEAIPFWADYDDQGITPVKAYGLAKMLDDLNRIAEDNKGQNTVVEGPARAMARKFVTELSDVIEEIQMAAIEKVAEMSAARNAEAAVGDAESNTQTAETPETSEPSGSDEENDFLTELDELGTGTSG